MQDWGKLVAGSLELMPTALYAAGEEERRAKGYKPVVVEVDGYDPETHYCPEQSLSEDDQKVVIRQPAVEMPAEVAAARMESLAAPVRAQAMAQVRDQARTARDAIRTPGKDGVYLLKLREADRWEADGKPAHYSVDGDGCPLYPWITREVGSTRPTAEELVALWRAMDLMWARDAGPAIEGVEQGALAALRAAKTPAAVEALRQWALAAFDAAAALRPIPEMPST